MVFKQILGNSLAYLYISLSLVTFASIDAQAMHALFASPSTMVSGGYLNPNFMIAVKRIISGLILRLDTAFFMARKVASKIFILSMILLSTVAMP
jgi:hypothetical protein